MLNRQYCHPEIFGSSVAMKNCSMMFCRGNTSALDPLRDALLAQQLSFSLFCLIPYRIMLT